MYYRKKGEVVIFLVLAILLSFPLVNAKDGEDDTTNWNKTFDGRNERDIPRSMAIDSQDNVYVVGNGTKLVGTTTGGDWWIKKFFSNSTDDVTNWNKTLDKEFQAKESAQGVALDSQDNVYVVGHGRNIVGGFTDYDWWIRKYNSSGSENTTNWNKTIDGPASSIADVAYAVAVDGNDNVYVVGDTTGLSDLDWWIKRFESNGTENATHWNKTFDAGNNERAYSVAVDSQNNVYVVGYGTNLVGAATGSDWWIKRFESNGTENTTHWNKTFDGNDSSDIAYSVAIDSNDNVYVVGYGANVAGASTNEDWWIKKFDSGGTENIKTWNKTFDAGNNERAYSVAVDSQSNVYVVGYGTNLIGATADEDWWIKKFSREGTEDASYWNKTFDGSDSSDIAYSVAIASNGSVYVAGYGTNLVKTATFEDWWIKKFEGGHLICTAGLTNSTTMFNDINCSGTAVIINSSNIALDCAGHLINYSTAGTLGYGVNNTGYDNVTVRNCNVIEGSATTNNKHGIYVENAANITLENNTLTIIGYEVAGAYIFISNFTTLINNTFNATGNYGYGLVFNGSNSSTVTENNISTNGSYGYGIYLFSSADNNLLLNNNLSVTNAEEIFDDTGDPFTNTLLYNNSFGQINWTGTNLTTNITLEVGNTIFLEDNLVGLTSDPEALQLNGTDGFNGTIQIELRGFSYNYTPYFLKDGIRCDDGDACNITYDSTNRIMYADINSFSNYSLSSCGYLNSDTTLTEDVNSTGTCFEINSSNLTLDCAGYTINYSRSGFGYGVNNTGHNNVTIENCNIITGSWTYLQEHPINVVNAVNGTIQNNNITLTGSDVAYGINLESTNYTNVTNNIINVNFANDAAGIYLANCLANFVNYNNITSPVDDSSGILIYFSSNCTFVGNNISSEGDEDGDITDRGDGIYITSSNFTNLTNNFINTTYRYGIEISRSFSTYIINNTIKTTGVNVPSDGIYILNSNNNLISYNNINTNRTPIYGEGANSSNISNNIIAVYGQGSGILLNNSINNICQENNISSINSYGIGLYDASTNNQLINNNISASNFFEIYDNFTTLNTLIYNNTFGQINWTLTNLTTNITLRLDTTIYLNNNSIGITDDSQSLNLDGVAQIELRQTKYSYVPSLDKDGVRCDLTSNCNITYSKSLETLYANISSFSNYSVNPCGYLNSSLTLTNNINSTTTCFDVISSSITLDCANYQINYSSDGTLGYGINNTGYDNVRIKNCNIVEGRSTTNNKHALLLRDADSGIIEHNTLTLIGAGSSGIDLESTSVNNLLFNNTVTSSTGYEIYDTTGSSYLNSLLYNSSYGQINWTLTNLTTNITLALDTTIYLNNNSIGITDDSKSLNLDGTAQIELRQTKYSYVPSLDKDGVRCDLTSNCNITYSKSLETLYANVNSFSNYSVNPCGFLNDSMTLSHDYNSNGTCFNISASGITLDCAGYQINYSGDGSLGYGISNTGYDNVRIKNCNVVEGRSTTNNKHALLFKDADSGIIEHNTITTIGIGSSGLDLESTSVNNLLFNNTVTSSTGYEIYDTTGSSYLNSLLYNSSYGQINWTLTNLTTNITLALDTTIYLNNNSIGITDDSEALNLDGDADLVINQLRWSSQPFLFKGDASCDYGDLCNITYDSVNGILYANVSSFSNYSTYMCGYLSTSKTLTENANFNGTCFTIAANDLTLDCAGYQINYSGDGTLGYGINNTGYSGLTLKNCNIVEGKTATNNKHALYLKNANDDIIQNNSITTIGTDSYGVNFEGTSSNSFLFNNTITSSNAYEIRDNTGSSYTNALLYNNTYGQINWTRTNLTTNVKLDIGTNIFLQNNLLGLTNSSEALNLNGEAVIRMNNFTYTVTPFLYKDGIRCDNTRRCNISSYNSTRGELYANITSFSNYTTLATAFTLNLTVGETGEFQLPEKSIHNLTLDWANNTNANATFGYSSVSFSLAIGQSKDIDTDSDNYYDHRITLDSSTSSWASFTISSIYSQIPQPETGSPTSRAQAKAAPKAKAEAPAAVTTPTEVRAPAQLASEEQAQAMVRAGELTVGDVVLTRKITGPSALSRIGPGGLVGGAIISPFARWREIKPLLTQEEFEINISNLGDYAILLKPVVEEELGPLDNEEMIRLFVRKQILAEFPSLSEEELNQKVEERVRIIKFLNMVRPLYKTKTSSFFKTVKAILGGTGKAALTLEEMEEESAEDPFKEVPSGIRFSPEQVSGEALQTTFLGLEEMELLPGTSIKITGEVRVGLADIIRAALLSDQEFRPLEINFVTLSGNDIGLKKEIRTKEELKEEVAVGVTVNVIPERKAFDVYLLIPPVAQEGLNEYSLELNIIDEKSEQRLLPAKLVPPLNQLFKKSTVKNSDLLGPYSVNYQEGFIFAQQFIYDEKKYSGEYKVEATIYLGNKPVYKYSEQFDFG